MQGFGSTHSLSRALAALTLGVLATAATARPVTLAGSAARAPGSIQLTNGTAVGAAAGAAWRTEPVSLDRSFTVDFTFSMTTAAAPLADGIAMVIETNGINAVGDGGGCIGVCGLNAVASVVQTYFNNHVGITLDANPYDAPPSPVSLSGTLRLDGREAVHWDATNHVLSMTGTLRGDDGRTVDVSDSRSVDLVALLGEHRVIVGFTGGTGDVQADQRITSFELVFDRP